LVSVREVPDPVFSEEMLGTGFAIDPVEGILAAPCVAQVVAVAPTQHSVTLRTDDGAELLIHIGLETVALKGRGFRAQVRDGDRVKAGDTLITFDLDLVGLEAKSLVTPVVLTNCDQFSLAIEPLDRLVARGEAIGSVERIGKAKNAAAAKGEATQIECVVGFDHGLHARPAARIAAAAKRFTSDVTLTLNGKSGSARSPVAIMALNAAKGDRVAVSATGEDAAAALEAIAAVLGAGEVSEPAAPALKTPPLAANEIGGICALPGVAIGTAFHWRRRSVDASSPARGTAHERAALDEAKAAVLARLDALGARTEGAAATIAAAHAGLLHDDEINAAALAEIDQGASAAAAWQKATNAAAGALRATGNPMLVERIADLEDACSQLIAALQGEVAAPAIELPDEAVLVADDLLPSELMSLPREQLAGLAIGGGGATSHVAIIAASFGVPTLVAMGPELSRVPEGARVLLDASLGKLVIDPDDRAQARAKAQLQQALDVRGNCVTRDGHRIALLANVGRLDDVASALAAGAEGCGLLRTEFLFLDRQEAPEEGEQLAAYQAIADALGGLPLTIRTLDIGGDKPVPYVRFPDEQNPALGVRGIRTGLFAPDLVDTQYRAIARIRASGVKVMVPMVSSVDELRAVRARLDELRDGDPIVLGVMVETPAAALIADQLTAEADFLSIGSNDLAQYALAMDRTNPLLAASIDALHPAVLRLIAMTAEAGAVASTPVSLCGGLASDPLGGLVLTGLGIRELSAVPAALASIRTAIGRVSLTDCRSLAERALRLESAAEVRSLAAELLNAGGK
jgi:phosphocarrier protein FPr/phosphocarrier protein